MYYTRKSSCLMMVVFLLGFCLLTFAQADMKKAEEHPVPVVDLCKCPVGTQLNALINIDFNGLTTSTYNIPAPNNPLPWGTPNHFYGNYAITDNPNSLNSNWITNSNLPPAHGNILVCNGYEDKETKLFGNLITKLVPGRKYCFLAWFRNLQNGGTNPKVILKIVPNQGSPVQSAELTLFPGNNWLQQSLTWICPPTVTQATLEIWLTSKAKDGNDVGVDDISFSECGLIQKCSCYKWDPVNISWWGAVVDSNVVVASGYTTGTTKCEECLNIGNVCLCQKISLAFNYICQPVSCQLKYTWNITGPNTYYLSGISSASPCIIQFVPTQPGMYSFTVTPKCGNKVCPPCRVNIIVEGIVQCDVPIVDPPETPTPLKEK